MDNTVPPNPGKVVLVVDDDDSVRDLLVVIARKEGFGTETAADGEEALRKARSLRPDLILLDMMIPKLGGFEVLHALQEDDAGDIPVVVITGRDMAVSTTDMIRREPNVREYLQKPVKPAALSMLMHQLLKTRPNLGR